MIEQLSEVQFFDPFAPQGEQLFDPTESHARLLERYQNNEVEHDYSVDRFVAETEALILDAHMVGMFDQASAIASQMHALCGHDQQLQQSMQNSAILGEQDDHIHPFGEEHSDHDDKKDGKKKKSKKKQYFGWLTFLNK